MHESEDSAKRNNAFDGLVEKLDKILVIIPVLALVIITVIIIIQIISRYIYPLPWTQELARVCNIWVVFIGAYLVTTRDGHVKIEYFTDFMPQSWQRWLDLLISIVCIISLLVIIYSGIRAILSLYAVKTAAARIPIPILFASTIGGASLMLIYIGVKALRILRLVLQKGEVKI
jgi:TRAP-type C4-dicarboxylate transport system permease small subunit